MRVVSGKARGKTLLAVPGDTTRPILDRVKTALFDIIRQDIAQAKVLDVFAGTGSVGIEALSQGVAHCIFLDLNHKACATIKQNLNTCNFQYSGSEAIAEVRNTDAFTYLRNSSKQFDLIYIAPPQYKSLWIEAMQLIASKPSLLSDSGLIIVQIDPSEYEILGLSSLIETEQRKYGKTLLVFYRNKK